MKQNAKIAGDVRSHPLTPNAFGLPNKPSTPIQGIINNTYANIAEQDLHKTYDEIE